MRWIEKNVVSKYFWFAITYHNILYLPTPNPATFFRIAYPPNKNQSNNKKKKYEMRKIRNGNIASPRLVKYTPLITKKRNAINKSLVVYISRPTPKCSTPLKGTQLFTSIHIIYNKLSSEFWNGRIIHVYLRNIRCMFFFFASVNSNCAGMNMTFTCLLEGILKYISHYVYILYYICIKRMYIQVYILHSIAKYTTIAKTHQYIF